MKIATFISFVVAALIAKCAASPVAQPEPEARPTWWFPIPIPIPSAPATSQGTIVNGANGGVNFGPGGPSIPAPPPYIVAPYPSNVVVTPGDSQGNGGSITVSG